MSRLGISLYPEHSTLAQDKAYISLAAKYGFQRIFTCLLSVKKSREDILKEFKECIDHAHANHMEVIVDVAPFVFDQLQISYDDLSFFQMMHADGIRLDEGFDGLKEALMSYNPQNLKIEINASFGNKSLDNIMSHYPKLENLITCHNFYPQRYSGLSYEHFMHCNRAIKNLNTKIAAFVTSQESDTFGPWPVYDGLPTLEMHRNLPIDVQARHLFATRMIDDVIVSNCFASEAELATLSKIDPGILTFKVTLERELQPIESKIIYEHHHFVRGDMSPYMARSTMPRVTYQAESVKPLNTRELKRGDVIIVNDAYTRYKGELQIVLTDMPNDGCKNVVGRIGDDEKMLLDFIKPWVSFAFMK